MGRILILLLITLNAHSMNVIPLTISNSEASLQLNLSSFIGVPVRSKATVGKVDRKTLQSELLNTAVFIIGPDPFSMKWLEENQKKLQGLQAIGFITNVNNFESIIALQEKYQLPLLPVNVDPLLNYIHESHYPLIIAEGEIWQ